MPDSTTLQYRISLALAVGSAHHIYTTTLLVIGPQQTQSGHLNQLPIWSYTQSTVYVSVAEHSQCNNC